LLGFRFLFLVKDDPVENILSQPEQILFIFMALVDSLLEPVLVLISGIYHWFQLSRSSPSVVVFTTGSIYHSFRHSCVFRQGDHGGSL
jgi:hypothetical protein